MKKVGFRFIGALVGAGIILSCSPPAFAQDSEDAFMLEEITVTAQKREENQQKVAIAMDVISGDKLKELGQTDVNQILGNVSSATINKTGNALRIAIRGVSDDVAEGTVQVTTPTAALNTDGIMTNRNQSGTGLFDIERVEVLVGPQSTLYASASPGGIVNVVSASPKLDKFGGNVTLEYGNYNLKHAEGALNVPVSDTVALRAAVSANVRDGYNSNGGDDQDQKAARLRALYQPSENFSVMVTGEVSKETGHGFATVMEFNDQDDDYYPDGVTPLDDPWTSSESALGNAMKNDAYKIYGTLNWDLGLVSMNITPSYNKSTSPSTGAGIDNRTGFYTTSVSDRTSDEKSVEVRLSSSEDFLFKWIAGFIWYEAYDEMTSDSLADDGSADGLANFNDLSNLDRVKAVYANVTYPITDTLRATAGIRYTDDYNHSVQNQSDGPPDLIMPMTVDQPYTKPSYKLGAEYDLGENSMLYADVSTAYRTQGMAFDSQGHVLPPEELTAFNLGAKNRFFGNKLQLNASAYYYDYKNFFGINSTDYIWYDDANGNDQYDVGESLRSQPDSNSKSVGDYEAYGLDLNATAILSDADKVDLAVSLMHGEYSDLVFDYSSYTNTPVVPGVIGTDDMVYDGKPKTNSPEVTITGSYTHNFNFSNGDMLTTRLDARYKSSYILTFSDSIVSYDTTVTPPTYTVTDLTGVREQEGYYTADLSATYARSSGKWSLTGYVKNVTDYAVKTSWTYQGAGGMMMIGPPRTFGAILSMKF